MNQAYKFTTTYHKEGEWYVALCPELGVSSQGETLEQAETNLKEAMELYLEDAPFEELEGFRQSPFVRMVELSKHA